MKKLYLLALLTIAQGTNAFFVNDAVVREKLQTMITTKNDKIEVVVITKLRNDTSEAKVVDYFYPLDLSVQDLHLYIDSKGRQIELLEGKGKREILFDFARKYQDHRFFRLESLNKPKVLLAKNITIPPKETIILKLKYTVDLDFLEDVFFKELFLSDEVLTEEFDLTLILDRPEKIKHFLPNYEQEGRVLNLGEQLVWRVEAKNIRPKQNFKFFFSEVADPVLTYRGTDATYFAHLIDKSKLETYSKVKIIIDQSGSVYKSAWMKEQEVLSVFLDKLSKEKNIKVIFWDEELYEFNDTFVSNTRENQKKLMEYFDQRVPMGKTNIDILLSFFEETDPDVLTIFLGDFDEGIVSRIQKLKTQNPQKPKLASFGHVVVENVQAPKQNNTDSFPFFFLDFSGNDKLKVFTEEVGGKYLHIFDDTKFVKLAEFWKLYNSIFKKSLSKDISYKLESEEDFLPEIYHRYSPDYSDFFVSRAFNEGENISNNLVSFLPKIWGQRKLEELEEGGEDLSLVLARNSIMRFFGVGENIEFKGASPLYFSEKNGWESYDFFEKASAENFIEVSPFSEAQRQLFLIHPDKVAEFFGMGSQVNFCYKDWRCVSVLKESRSEALGSDLFFWNGFHLGHWANKYLKVLVDRDVLKISEGGDGMPNQKITRGEFVQMAVEYKYGKDFEREELLSEPLVDLDANLYITDVVNLLIGKGIIQGYSDKTFRPHRNLSRAEAVKILLSLEGVVLPAEFIKNKDPVFTDIDGWENFWVTTAQKQGMVKGYEDGRFWPHRTVSRAEASKLIVEGLSNY